DPVKETDDGIDVWFRDSDLDAMAKQELAEYIATEAGESKLIDRSWSDAPPLIPHTVEDMLPITSDDNECMNCHHPDNVTSKKDLPLPESHFDRPVIVEGKKNEAMRNRVDGYKKADDVVGSRYDCMMCHAPQAGNVKSLKSLFRGDEAKK
ncbi:MAG: nitrate reductase cytochrome c-type subunit, partial [Deltaproteobacteria bacterium]|nr:nitrate reductase cytochrome c-type subunit [Deltaproteobacteria bacterium]